MWSATARSLAPTSDAAVTKPPASLAETKIVSGPGASDSSELGGHALAPGCVLSDRYRVERCLGEGAMGAVFLAEHVMMHKRVAVKVLHAEMGDRPDVVARFEREAVAASHIEHPNVAAATDFGKLPDGSFFLVLEYIEGISLRDALNQYGALPPRRALHIARQVCAALCGAHVLGIVHRDLKPENIMLVDRGDDPDFVKVLDFGIARVPMNDLASQRLQNGSVLTRVGMVYGTPAYMAPEQALGEAVDARADLYSLGILLFEMLTGSRPFDAPNEVMLLAAQVTAPVPSMQERRSGITIDLRLEAFVRHLLEKSPADRPADAFAVEETLLELAPACPNEAVRWGSVRPPAPTPIAPHPQRLPPPVLPSSPPLWSGSSERPGSALSASLAPSPHAPTVGWPPKRKQNAVRIGGAALAFGALVTVIARACDAPAAPASVTAVPVGNAAITPQTPNSQAYFGAAGTDVPAAEQSAATAIRHFQHCEIQAGRSILERARENVGRAEFQRVIASGCFANGNATVALSALAHLSNAQPDDAVGPAYLADIEKAATVPATMDAAYSLLEAHPNAAAVDVLYRLTFAPNSQVSISRAERALLVPHVRKQASRPLAVALALKEAGQDCEAVQYFGEAADVGDGRALAYLDLLGPLHSFTYRKTPGQKKPVVVDAYACLHKNGALVKAITAIKSRLARAN
ncbi:MAG: serine/threonine-protein kinase [Polyangiaceae bacterium]